MEERGMGRPSTLRRCCGSASAVGMAVVFTFGKTLEVGRWVGSRYGRRRLHSHCCAAVG